MAPKRNRSHTQTVIPGETGDLLAALVSTASTVSVLFFPNTFQQGDLRVDTRRKAGMTYLFFGTALGVDASGIPRETQKSDLPHAPSVCGPGLPTPPPNHPKGILIGWLGQGSGQAKCSIMDLPHAPIKNAPFIPVAQGERTGILWQDIRDSRVRGSERMEKTSSPEGRVT